MFLLLIFFPCKHPVTIWKPEIGGRLEIQSPLRLLFSVKNLWEGYRRTPQTYDRFSPRIHYWVINCARSCWGPQNVALKKKIPAFFSNWYLLVLCFSILHWSSQLMVRSLCHNTQEKCDILSAVKKNHPPLGWHAADTEWKVSCGAERCPS